MLKLNDVTVKSPSRLLINPIEIGTKERTASGLTVYDRVGRKKRLDIQWRFLTSAELNLIFTNTNMGFFNVEYPGPSGVETMTCYTEHFEAGMLRPDGWEDTRLELMER